MGWVGVLGGVAHGATEEFKRHEDLEGKIRIAAAKKSDTGLATLQKEVAKLGGDVSLTDTKTELLAKLKKFSVHNKDIENFVSMSDMSKESEKTVDMFFGLYLNLEKAVQLTYFLLLIQYFIKNICLKKWRIENQKIMRKLLCED